jgi:hypothetical protein
MELWIVSPEDLVLSKLEWARDSGSELQMRDVRHLLKATLDQGYLRQWAVKLSLEPLLKEASRE